MTDQHVCDAERGDDATVTREEERLEPSCTQGAVKLHTLAVSCPSQLVALADIDRGPGCYAMALGRGSSA